MAVTGSRRPGKLALVNGTELYFDYRPMELAGGIRFEGRSVKIAGRPSAKEFQNALILACNFYESCPYWIGGLVAYAENRRDWKDKLDQIMSVTGLARQTLLNLGYVYRNVSERVRQLAPTPTHAAEVAALPPAEQARWMDLARTEGMTVRDLRLTIRASQRRKVIEGQAQLEGMHRVIYSDNPWSYGRAAGVTSAEDHYEGMTVEDQCKLPVAAHALPDSVLLMWTTAPTILQNPGPRDVGEAWGFTYKQQIVWDKVDGVYSHYTGGNHEILTIWTRGSCVPDLPTDLPDSVQVIRKSRVHSEKPEDFRRLIEKHWTRGPYLELFGREPHEGWTVFGNDARLWATQAEAQSELNLTVDQL